MFVRTVEPLDVSEVVDGKSWSAVLARGINNPDGRPLISAGSPLYFGVQREGGALGLIVRSVVWNGNAYIVNVPVTPGEGSVAGLEPWGATATTASVQLQGERIFVPGQTLLALKLGGELTLR